MKVFYDLCSCYYNWLLLLRVKFKFIARMICWTRKPFLANFHIFSIYIFKCRVKEMTEMFSVSSVSLLTWNPTFCNLWLRQNVCFLGGWLLLELKMGGLCALLPNSVEAVLSESVSDVVERSKFARDVSEWIPRLFWSKET